MTKCVNIDKLNQKQAITIDSESTPYNLSRIIANETFKTIWAIEKIEDNCKKRLYFEFCQVVQSPNKIKTMKKFCIWLKNAITLWNNL